MAIRLEKRVFDAPYLRSILYYGVSTGYFWWLIDKPQRSKAGLQAGYFNSGSGYWEIDIGEYVYRTSNLAWLWVTGEWPPLEIDHKNRIKTDDRWENLRLATHSQNAANTGLRSTNTSGVKGVYWNHFSWEARIWVDNGQIYLGSFDTKEEAAIVRRAAELKYWGEFAPQYATE